MLFKKCKGKFERYRHPYPFNALYETNTATYRVYIDQRLGWVNDIRYPVRPCPNTGGFADMLPLFTYRTMTLLNVNAAYHGFWTKQGRLVDNQYSLRFTNSLDDIETTSKRL